MRPLLPIPHPCPARARPTALPLFWQESDPLLLARQSPPGSSPSAEDARERAGGLVSTPRRAARRRVGVLLLDTLSRTSHQSSR